MIEHGRVVAVEEEVLGGELAADASIGATTLLIEGLVTDFGEGGGDLKIENEVLAYDSINDDAQSIHLTTPTTVLHVTGKRVDVYPERRRYWAHVAIDDAGDEIILAKITHALKMHLSDNIQDPLIDDQPPVVIELIGGDWEVVNIEGVLPGLVGGSLDIPDVGQIGVHINRDGTMGVGGTTALNGVAILGIKPGIGGQLLLGDGVNYGNLYSGSDSLLTTDGRLAVGDGITVPYLTGPGKRKPVDADFLHTPPNGTIAIVQDTTAGVTIICFRGAGVWKGIVGTATP